MSRERASHTLGGGSYLNHRILPLHRVGFIEIYNEKVYDLYDPDNVDLKMVEKNNDAYVNCKEAICKSVEDMYNVIKIGNKNKKIGDTDMNDRSSRSHTIFRIVSSGH